MKTKITLFCSNTNMPGTDSLRRLILVLLQNDFVENNKINIVLGPLPHSLSSESSSPHDFPLQYGLGYSHFLVRFSNPSQVFEHVPHELHFVQPPSTET